MEMSDIIRKHLPADLLKTDDLLRERAPIPPEPPVSCYTVDDHKYFQEGARIEAAFRKYIHRADASVKSKHVYKIIVCHANVIRYFLCRALQFPPEAWLRYMLYHCSITWITITPSGNVIVMAVGDFGYIPKEKMSFS